MGIRKKTPAEIFSWTTIAVSLGLLSGMAMGDVTRESMHARLSATPPADPVERYALGQNAYDRTSARLATIPAQPTQYANAGYEIGRYKNGTRILAPAEPARKSDRLRLERLQDWNEQSFGEAIDDEPVDYAEPDEADQAPINVGAVMEAPESTASAAPCRSRPRPPLHRPAPRRHRRAPPWPWDRPDRQSACRDCRHRRSG